MLSLIYDSPWVYAAYIVAAICVVVYVGLTIIVTIGGTFDLVYMFKQLKKEIVDERDDGSLEKNQ